MGDLIARLKAAQLRGNAKPEDTGTGGLLDQAAERIAELEALARNYKESWDGAALDAEGLETRAEAAEAALREVGELPDKWKNRDVSNPVSPEMGAGVWIGLDAAANELRAILAKHGNG